MVSYYRTSHSPIRSCRQRLQTHRYRWESPSSIGTCSIVGVSSSRRCSHFTRWKALHFRTRVKYVRRARASLRSLPLAEISTTIGASNAENDRTQSYFRYVTLTYASTTRDADARGSTIHDPRSTIHTRVSLARDRSNEVGITWSAPLAAVAARCRVARLSVSSASAKQPTRRTVLRVYH